jgi:hypothetical protein
MFISNLNFVAPGNISGKITRRTDYGTESQMGIPTPEMTDRFLHQEQEKFTVIYLCYSL